MVGKKRSPAAQMFILILFIGLPGMITGTALASVATTGLMAGRYLLDKGMEKSKVVEVDVYKRQELRWSSATSSSRWC